MFVECSDEMVPFHCPDSSQPASWELVCHLQNNKCFVIFHTNAEQVFYFSCQICLLVLLITAPKRTNRVQWNLCIFLSMQIDYYWTPMTQTVMKICDLLSEHCRNYIVVWWRLWSFFSHIVVVIASICNFWFGLVYVIIVAPMTHSHLITSKHLLHNDSVHK